MIGELKGGGNSLEEDIDEGLGLEREEQEGTFDLRHSYHPLSMNKTN